MFNYKRTRIVFIILFIVLVQLDVTWPYLVAVPITFSVLAFIMAFPIQANFYLKAHKKSPQKNASILGLSFDDGPHSQTPEILDCLSRHKIKAAFFVVGIHAEQQPDTLKRIVNEGHVVGNHSYSHNPMLPFWWPKRILADIERNNALIKNLTGKTMNWFRPPIGITNPMVAKAIHQSGMQTVAWSLRTFDTQLSTAKLKRRLKRKMKNGQLLLLHDTTSNMVELIDYIVELAEKKGIKIVTPDELLQLKAYIDED